MKTDHLKCELGAGWPFEAEMYPEGTDSDNAEGHTLMTLPEVVHRFFFLHFHVHQGLPGMLASITLYALTKKLLQEPHGRLFLEKA